MLTRMLASLDARAGAADRALVEAAAEEVTQRHDRTAAMEQRHDGAERRVDPGDRVADRYPDPHRRPVGISDQLAHAADRLGDGGEAGSEQTLRRHIEEPQFAARDIFVHETVFECVIG